MKTLVKPYVALLFGLVMLLQGCNLDKVNPNQDPPEADFTIGNSGCTASCIVSFDASTSKNAVSYEWDFGDGNSGTGESTTHTYDLAGDFSVKLIVSGSGGATDSLVKTVTIIEDETVRASFMIDSVTCQGFAPVEVFITNLSQFATTYSWVWGDGTASQDENPGSHVFENPGTYNIKLTVSDGMGGSSDTTVSFTVLSPITFQMDYGQSGFYEEGWGMTSTSDDGFLIAGYYLDTAINDFNPTATIQKINSNGNQVWKKDYPTSLTKITAYRLPLETSDGGIAICGLKSDNDTTTFRYDIHFVKMDADGNITVDKTYGDSENSENGAYIAEAPDGNFYILSQKRIQPANTTHPWVIKVDKNGNLLWDKMFGTLDTRSNYPSALIATPDNGFAFIGRKRRSGGNDYDMWFLKGDKDGNGQIEKTYGTVVDETDAGNNLIQTANGGYAFLGYTNGKGNGSSDIWLVRVDVNGNLIWDKTYGTMESENGSDLIEDKDGNFVLANSSRGQSFGFNDYWIIKTDANGNMIWDKDFGGPRSDYPYSVVATNDCGYAVAGSLAPASGDNYQALFIKLDNDGNVN